jgi:hypothetical protein
MAERRSSWFHVFTITIILSMFVACGAFAPAWGEERVLFSAEEKEKSAAPTPWTQDFIRKRPYLIYRGKNTSMTVLWQTYQTPAKATIEWGATTSYGKGPVTVHEDGKASDQHQFQYTIPNLTPGAKYYYKVSNDGFPYTGSFTAAPAAAQTVLSFYGYGDSQQGYLSNPVNQNSVLGALMTDMNGNPGARQTLIVNMGDYVFNGLNEFYWDMQQFNLDPAYDNIYAAFANFPFMGVLGNHEGFDSYVAKAEVSNYQNTGELFRKYYPYIYPNNNRFYYSFDYGPIHFVIIDTWSYEGASDTQQAIDNAQANWLKQNLKASKKPWKIAMLHTPIWQCTQGIEALQTQLTPILKAGGVHLVFQGHHHYYSRAETEGPYTGMTFLTLGGGGAHIDAPEACVPETNKVWPPVAAFTFHFARFDISGNVLTGTVIDSSGNVIDTFQVTNLSN